jgi:hypothetical protein
MSIVQYFCVYCIDDLICSKTRQVTYPELLKKGHIICLKRDWFENCLHFFSQTQYKYETEEGSLAGQS